MVTMTPAVQQVSAGAAYTVPVGGTQTAAYKLTPEGDKAALIDNEVSTA